MKMPKTMWIMAAMFLTKNTVSRKTPLTTATATATATKTIKPMSASQSQYMKALQSEKPMVVAYGPAGCGKTLLACEAFAKMHSQGKCDKLILTRPLVPVEGEQLGFLPGDVHSKMEPWTQPVFDHLSQYYSTGELNKMIQNRIVEIVPLAFMRGRTFHRSFIMGDEMQNSTPLQWLTLITRCGLESKMVLMGDLQQSDLGIGTQNALADFIAKEATKPLPLCEVVRLENDSICRSPLVKQYLEWGQCPR